MTNWEPATPAELNAGGIQAWDVTVERCGMIAEAYTFRDEPEARRCFQTYKTLKGAVRVTLHSVSITWVNIMGQETTLVEEWRCGST